jgi:hypothetical protein
MADQIANAAARHVLNNVTLPPTGDVGELVKRLREAYAKVSDWPERKPDGFLDLLALRNLVPDAADALTASAARIAELEREIKARKNYTDEDYIRLHNAHCFTANKLASATARAERLEAALRETWRVLDAAGTLNLTRGVQLGPTSWYVKIEDARLESRAALSPAPNEGGDDE